MKLTWVITLGISAGSCFYFGLRDSNLILVTLVAAVPASFIVHAVIGLVSSAPLELVSAEGDTAGKTDGKPVT
jgi:hypothetical protein